MTWDAGSPTIGRIFSTRLEDALGPARAAGDELEAAAPRRRRRPAGAARGARTSTSSARCGSATGSPNLCLAGGVALNAVANGRIRPETPFEELYVQPAAGDSGTAVGAAFHVWNRDLGGPRGFVMEHAYTGPEYGDEELEAALAAAGVDARAS